MLPSVPSSVFSYPQGLLPGPPDAAGSVDFSFPENPILALVVEEERRAPDNDKVEPPPIDTDSMTDVDRDLAEFPILLRNDAWLLVSRGNVDGAEDYYHRATVADPEDGKTLMQYAKLVWELHHDQHKALTYFKLAAEASPNDSDVLAALASFLWEIGDDEEVEREDHNQDHVYELETSCSEVSPSHNGGESSSSSFTSGKRVGGEGEEYFLNMIKENTSDPLLLRNYAQFLYQSKQDLHKAMEYYSRASHANPADGESLVMYAKLVWQLRHDHNEASRLFERAINAVPGDCYILAAHASFLWDTDGHEE